MSTSQVTPIDAVPNGTTNESAAAAMLVSDMEEAKDEGRAVVTQEDGGVTTAGAEGEQEKDKANEVRNPDDSSRRPTNRKGKNSVLVEHAEESGHGHHAVKTGLVQSAFSAVVCFVIYFFFCIVFSSVVFDPLVTDAHNPPFGVVQGVHILLIGIAVGSVFFARYSGCKAVIGGPDLLPLIFAAEIGTAVTTYLEARSDYGGGYGDSSYGGGYADSSYADSSYSSYADSSYADSGDHRRLAGDGPKLDERTKKMLIPTVLVAMMIGNALTGLLFFGLGHAKSTAAAIGFIPASVVSGFL